jgi:hypothetical protein
MDLLTKVTIGCGPSIYNADAATVAGSQAELETVKNNFLIKKLGLSDGANLDAGIDAVIENMGDLIKVNRAVVYYLLAVHFKRRCISLIDFYK